MAYKVLTVRPLGGMWKADPADEIPEGTSPDMQNFTVWRGMLVKRPGYIRLGNTTAVGTPPCTGIYWTKDANDNSYLYATSPVGLSLYSSGAWAGLAGTVMSGSASQLFSFETSQNALVFSQGVDNIQTIGLGAAPPYGPLNANSKPSRYLTRFADRLYAAFTVEGSTQPYRVRWPVNSDHTNWTGLGSGFRDNTEQPYFIRGMMKLIEQLVVYTEKSAIVGTRTGALPPAQYDITVTDAGLLCPFSLCGWVGTHLLIGNDDFYQFNGSRFQPLGAQIRDHVFASLNPSAVLQNFSVVLNDTQEWVNFIATGASATPNMAWVYNMARGGIWYPWVVSGSPTCATLFRLDNTVTIDSLVGTIDQQTWEFDSRQLLALYPALVTGHADGNAFKWGTAYPSDNGVAIDCWWSSKDYRCMDFDPAIQNRMITMHGVSVQCVDTGAVTQLDLYYSTDGGATYQGPYSKNIGGVSSGATLDITYWQQVTGQKVRFRFRNTSASNALQIVSFHPIIELGAQITP